MAAWLGQQALGAADRDVDERVMAFVRGTLALVAVLVWAVYALPSWPPRDVVIEAGPAGGTYAQHAQAYAAMLGEQGFRVELRHNPDSMTIIDHVNEPASGVDIGFVAQHVNPQAHPRVRALAAIELQPLFLFHSVQTGALESLDELRGLRIALPAASSATSTTALDLLSLYGVTPSNTPIEFLDIHEAARRLRQGDFDAGFFMLAPDHTLILDLAADESLVMFHYVNATATARRFRHLVAARMPAGTVDLSKPSPTTPVDLLAAEVQVIAHAELHPAVTYAMLDAMARRHSPATAISDRGQYPSFDSETLPLADAVRDVQRSGPSWPYRVFGPRAGSLVVQLSVIVLAMLLFVQVYHTFKYLNEGLTAIGLAMAGMLLGRHMRRHRAGKRPRWPGRMLLAWSEWMIERRTIQGWARQRLDEWHRISRT